MTDLEFAEAACCIWEEFLEIRKISPGKFEPFSTEARILQGFEDEGTSAMRLKAINLAERCHYDYLNAIADGYDDCFDWDFVPNWIREHYNG